ncbi:YciI family protein [Sphaerisporangium sp. TRM90804]|uniref:YciI family protein n=1 Tax=Sphaerisporangium sp. TRM90804 TaxID=3031113 RepID=UPI0024485854|nr:YciI family protein [Sphaerisporangium sp. TRM90804]MDH2424974.1 YciI family protein [Sphaerisporangium sp. TRM90804]
MPRFVLHMTFRNDDARLAVRPAHREHLRELQSKGTLLTAGPWADDSGALHVYQADDEAEVRSILARDPYTAVDGYEVTFLKEWTVIVP